ncbi:ADP-ribosylation factor-binding protein GGA3a [Erpetoichthys calabaricus]|uniref:Golgi associated, gamma adaptin ear containing, ARF binding protein 3a n=1 Tax=Erpetoichthys calabaricus TaxID=27687 RepID=A0A8C4THL9_ERPCA|nr:ADP-ribosylation factor-binding protein GGA3a [Erpetoichthys calabaricus]
MADPEGETLECWLNKATNPSNRVEDWEYIIGFCDQINKELEGPQIAVRLLAHKIQSPQEWEALQALSVLEACMKNCGRRFHNEVGKFRFLNELIKVVSPKYLGDRVSEKVKRKVIEMLYSWAVALPDEAKINEAYQMLKKQGIVSVDPEIPVDKTLIPSPPTRPKNPVFEDEEKSKRLAELLKSKNPEDLQEANRLIKNMVKEDEARMQKVTKRVNTLEEVKNNVKLLNEMLIHFNKDESSDADKELMKELYDRSDKMRRTVFKLATETEDNDSSLGDILQASDDLSRVINSYKRIVEGQTVNGELDIPASEQNEGCKNNDHSEALIDLVGLEIVSPAVAEPAPVPDNPLVLPAIPVLPPPPLPCSSATSQSRSSSQTEHFSRQPSTALSLLDEELLSLGLNDPLPIVNNGSEENAHNSQWAVLQVSFDKTSDNNLDFLSQALPKAAPSSSSASWTACGSYASVASMPAPVQEIGQSTPALDSAVGRVQQGDSKGISDQLDPASLFNDIHGTISGSSAVAAPLIFHDVRKTVASSSTPGSPLFQYPSPVHLSSQGSPAKMAEVSLANVHVPLESITPSKVLPVTAYDKNGVRVLFHFAKDCPPGRPDVLVIVVSMLNTAPLPVRNVVLQAAVPKSMKVKLQPPSGTELASFNPVLPPAAITQIMLLANPTKERVRLRYKLTFMLGEQQCDEVGEVDKFPSAENWGSL